MGLFSRIVRVIKGWLLIGVEKAEDPEIILREAQESMQREFETSRRNAAEALAARNELRKELESQQRVAADLEAKARQALKMGDEELAKQLLVEKSTYDTTVTALNVQMEKAEQAAEAVKASLKSMQSRIRQRTAERLAMEAGWKQAKIAERLNSAMSGMSLDGSEQQFRRAEERIRKVQAMADAQNELAQDGMAQKMAKLNTAVESEQANAALEAMKKEMGLLPPATEEVDPLARLKAEISQEEQPVQQKLTS